ncbi:hypothetical protein KBD68_04675 [Candidatus Woesebacteria bacterium]|nr:hypothetical protein [Candidatus Woesebacteria bacterium]
MNGKTDHAKAMKATFIEVCFLLGVLMALLWAVVFAFWKLNLLDTRNPYIASLIIWGFKMGFSGGVNIFVAPLARFSLDMPVRDYHYPSILIGLMVTLYTWYQLSISHMFDLNMFWFLAIPAFMAFVMMSIKNRGTGLGVAKNELLR